MSDIAPVGHINIQCIAVKKALHYLKYQKLNTGTMHALITIKCVGHRYPVSLHLRSPRPSWVGMMQPIHAPGVDFSENLWCSYIHHKNNPGIP